MWIKLGPNLDTSYRNDKPGLSIIHATGIIATADADWLTTQLPSEIKPFWNSFLKDIIGSDLPPT